MKDEPKKVKLDMTKEEVIEILGEPDESEEDGWYVKFYYIEEEPYTKREVRFMEGVVISISIYGVESRK